MNPACAAALGPALKHRCWDAMVAQQYITTPTFIAQNMFDDNQINDELLCPPNVCSTATKSKVGRAFLQDYGRKAVASVRAALAGHKGWGAFVPGCLQHTDDMCMTEGPRIGTGGQALNGRSLVNGSRTYASGHSYGEALGAWFFERGGVNTTLFDSCSDGLPCNPQCSGFHCQDS